ncbi:prealbumin-like fold domain-containing protein [Pedobacter sp. KR3-3]|uniref:Prealbumin-like fold domain-containing protein n=1 Tax=Pedobacter albus TaxID=3113905 RepID=A0ABU7I9D7_9SPHI|nr:prealbumin-like fold domain-containing protein [Pedobacter sp. KR3-3]MEE1945979.1 prealbumin-like fold domain-containing protein [Pedobacter sp. KR3-3]
MKKLFIILIFLFPICLNAQENRPGNPIGGIIVKGGKNPGGNMLLSLGGGLNSPSGNGKTNANLVNSYALNANVYVPLFAKGDHGTLAGETSHFFTVGVNAGGEYFSGSKAYDLNTLPAYQITGQSAAPSLALNNNQNKQHGFRAEAGVQANFSFGQLTLSPGVNAGYLRLQQNALSVTQSSSVNGKTYSKEIYSREAVQTTGFALAPKLRVAYFPGRFGFYVEGNYTSGPTVNSEAMLFKPQGNANADGFYSQDQLAMGNIERVSQSTKYSGFGLSIGVSIPLGKSISEPGVKRSAARASDKLPPRTYTGGRKNEAVAMTAGNPIGGIIVKGGKNPGGSSMTLISNEKGEFDFTITEAGNYKFAISEPDQPQGRSISEKGVKRTEGSAARQTQGKTFGEKVSQGLAMTTGTPIGGIVVKGGKNPGGNLMTVTTNEQGEFEFKNLDAGEYKFTITAPEGQGKSISEKGVSSTKSRKN